MISKYKILQAIQEGIQSGFKFSTNSNINDSSYIDFSDSKINNVKSLHIDKLLDEFQKYVKNKNYSKVIEFYHLYGFQYTVKNNKQLKKIINDCIEQLGNDVDLNWIDITPIKNLKHLFSNSSFNGDISNWNVSNVNVMYYMFSNSKFTGDISKWDVSNVKDMFSMFSQSIFNGDISNWNVSNVKDMSWMFSESKFNQDISKWNVSNVKDMHDMFSLSSFNQNISNWNVSNVKDMTNMFEKTIFNQNISKWKISSKCKINNIFKDCPIENKNKPKNM